MRRRVRRGGVLEEDAVKKEKDCQMGMIINFQVDLQAPCLGSLNSLHFERSPNSINMMCWMNSKPK